MALEADFSKERFNSSMTELEHQVLTIPFFFMHGTFCFLMHLSIIYQHQGVSLFVDDPLFGFFWCWFVFCVEEGG